MNPLTQLRKLGIAIVGKDGILDTAAAAAHGFGPMAKVKLQEEARDRILKEQRDQLGLQADQLGVKKAGVDVEAAITNLNQDKELFPGVKQKQQLDIAGQQTRNTGDVLDNAVKGANLRKITKEEADDDAMAEFLANELQVPKERALPVLRAYKELYASGSVRKDKDGKITIEDTDVVAERNAQRRFLQTEARDQFNRDRQFRADQERNKTITDKAFSEVDDAANTIMKDPEYRSDQILTSRQQSIEDALKTLSTSGLKGTISKGTATPVIITAFNKITDALSVVRGEEYARTEAEQSMLKRAKGYLSSFSQGSNIDASTLNEIATITRIISQRAQERRQQKIEDFKSRIKQRPLTSDVPDSYVDKLFNNTSKSGAFKSGKPKNY